MLTNKTHLHRIIYNAVLKDTYDLSKSDPKYLSGSTLPLPPKIRLLRMRHYDEIVEDVLDGIWKLMGEAAHYILRKGADKKMIVEKRFNVKYKVDGIKKIVSCKPDLYDRLTGAIHDWKFTKVWTYVFRNDEGSTVNIQWMPQLNCYAWCLRKRGLKVSKLYVTAFLQDWTESKNDHDTYPPEKALDIEIPLWSPKQQDLYVAKRVYLHAKCESLADDDIPHCSKPERWYRGEKWAVTKMKKAEGEWVPLKRSIKNHDNQADAEQHLKNLQKDDPKNKYFIDYREGTDTRCLGYCNVNRFCDYFRQKYMKEWPQFRVYYDKAPLKYELGTIWAKDEEQALYLTRAKYVNGVFPNENMYKAEAILI